MNKIVLLSILALFSTSILLTQTIFAQTVENDIIENTLDTVEKATNSTTLNTINPKNINQNSLVACVDYLINEYETQKEGLSESVQQGLDSTINENMLNLIVVAICDIGYEHTGKYSHLLPKDMQNKYAKLAATQIFLEKKSFETFNPDPLDPEMFLNKLLSPSTVNASALGDAESKITIVEFGDYQDSVSTQFHHETMDAIIQKFVKTGKVKFLFKDLIVNDLPRDKVSSLAAESSYCAAEQGKYWEYHDELFKNSQGENTGWVTKNNLKHFANITKIKVITKFSECLESSKYGNLVVENNNFARSLGFIKSPTFIFYNGTTPAAFKGAQSYETFEQIIHAME